MPVAYFSTKACDIVAGAVRNEASSSSGNLRKNERRQLTWVTRSEVRLRLFFSFSLLKSIAYRGLLLLLKESNFLNCLGQSLAPRPQMSDRQYRSRSLAIQAF